MLNKSIINIKHFNLYTEGILNKSKLFINKMLFEEKEVTKYGNSRVVNISKLKEGSTIYILDAEMLEFIRGIKLENER